MLRKVALFLLLASLSFSAVAVTLSSEAQEERYWRLVKDLRCLVCQGESIADSQADLAKDLRMQVRVMIRDGASDAEVIDYMAARYGDFILFRPPLRIATVLLWLGPFFLLLSAVIVIVRRIRHHKEPLQLSPAERQRARDLLRGETE